MGRNMQSGNDGRLVHMLEVRVSARERTLLVPYELAAATTVAAAAHTQNSRIINEHSSIEVLRTDGACIGKTDPGDAAADSISRLGRNTNSGG